MHREIAIQLARQITGKAARSDAAEIEAANSVGRRRYAGGALTGRASRRCGSLETIAGRRACASCRID